MTTEERYKHIITIMRRNPKAMSPSEIVERYDNIIGNRTSEVGSVSQILNVLTLAGKARKHTTWVGKSYRHKYELLEAK